MEYPFAHRRRLSSVECCSLPAMAALPPLSRCSRRATCVVGRVRTSRCTCGRTIPISRIRARSCVATPLRNEHTNLGRAAPSSRGFSPATVRAPARRAAGCRAPRVPIVGESRVNSRLGPVSELTPLQRQGRAAASAATSERQLEPRRPAAASAAPGVRCRILTHFMSAPAPPSLDRWGDRLPRRLGLWSAVAVVVGSTIGSGIFRTPASIAQRVDDVPLFLLSWVLGGAVTLCGALTYAELAAMFPRSGGIYVFIREAFGPLPAFLFGWGELLIIRPGAYGAISITSS